MSSIYSFRRGTRALSVPSADVRPIVIARAVVALVWAGGLLLATRHHMFSAHAALPVLAAALLATYPAIDAIASLLDAVARPATSRVPLLNAAISSAAVVALAIVAFGSDAATALIAFGAWAAVSGAILLLTAFARLRAGRRQISMIISGSLSTVAGLSFIAMSSSHDAHVKNLAGYMALGAVLFLVSALRPSAAER